MHSFPLAESFQTTIHGESVDLVVLINQKGWKAALTNYGARLVSLHVPDKKGTLLNVVSGFNSIQQYLNARETYYGATVGRYANRIANACFSIGSNTYQLEAVHPSYCLHGGPEGFHKKVWAIQSYTENTVTLSLESPDGDMGFPGRLAVTVTYHLSENGLQIQYQATSDKPTVCNLTHHSFFNLNGEGLVNDHLLQINASLFLPLSGALLPTGERRAVQSTPFDFSSFHAMGERMEANEEQVQLAGGYDHNFVLSSEKNRPAAIAIGDQSGICMELFTDKPGLQFYTSNFLSGKDRLSNGNLDTARSSFCLEPQYFPDSPNQPEFPSALLWPGETYCSETELRFTNSLM